MLFSWLTKKSGNSSAYSCSGCCCSSGCSCSGCSCSGCCCCSGCSCCGSSINAALAVDSTKPVPDSAVRAGRIIDCCLKIKLFYKNYFQFKNKGKIFNQYVANKTIYCFTIKQSVLQSKWKNKSYVVYFHKLTHKLLQEE